MRQRPSLLKELGATPLFKRNLADDIIDYCRRKQCDPYAELICEDRDLPPKVLEAWRTDEVRAYFCQALNAPEAPDDELPQDQPAADDEAATCDWACALIGKHFMASNEGNYTPYRITDRNHYLLQRMEVLHLEDQVAIAIRDELREQGKIITTPKVKKLMDYWRLHAPRIPEPPLRLQFDEPGWCLSRATIIPDPSLPFPTWQSFTSRLNDPEAFGAFIAGVYYRLNPKARQVLWLSAYGEDGKSEVLLALLRMVGQNVSKSINSEQLKGRFFTSAFVGVAFAIVPDNNNPRLVMTGAFKEITGGDRVPVERKFQAAYDAFLNCKSIVIGNCEPDISAERSNYSRTLWLKLERIPEGTPIDVTWGERLDAEAPGFLAWCLKCYEERCVGNYEIKVNAVAQAAKDMRVRLFEERFALGFARWFEVDPQGRVDDGVVYDRLHQRETDGLGLTDLEIANFTRWMNARHHIELTSSNGHYYYKGMRLKGAGARRGPSVADDMMGEPKEGAGFVMHGYTGPQVRDRPNEHAHV